MMNTTRLSHALPLIPPSSDCMMTVAECESQIRHLKDVHCAAVQVFWDSLKTQGGTEGAGTLKKQSLRAVQLDLCTLHEATKSSECTRRIPSPELSVVKSIWNEVTQGLRPEVRAAIAMTDFEILDLVGVVTLDGSTLFIHRYQGAQVPSDTCACLDVVGGAGAYWQYRAYHYQPDGFEDEAYSMSGLYVVGEMEEDSGAWVPRALTHEQLHEVMAMVDVMECLVDEDTLGALMNGADVLPSFPSGVESTLLELKLLCDWLRDRLPVHTRPEVAGMNVVPFRSTPGVQLTLVGFEATSKPLNSCVRLQPGSARASERTQRYRGE